MRLAFGFTFVALGILLVLPRSGYSAATDTINSGGGFSQGVGVVMFSTVGQPLVGMSQTANGSAAALGFSYLWDAGYFPPQPTAARLWHLYASD